MSDPNSPFWVVWSPKNTAVLPQHPTFELALAEAKRLANRQDAVFFVLQAVALVQARVTVDATPIHLAPQPVNGVTA